MALATGVRLGSYEIVSPLGKGGMGEVYRARDRDLDREVAIKVLPEEVARDEERLERFEREAKALAALNHPNIATLHGFLAAVPLPVDPGGTSAEDEIRFLVMELVEGETLAERLARGPIALEEALALFVQIAHGLEAAHAKGIVHRDLKPANLKIEHDASSVRDQVKILDFGLAKAMSPETAVSGDPDLSVSPTLTLAATRRGEVMGTAGYMSPEQAKGKPIDRRTDVWAFGVCLLEALSGKRAFKGSDASEVLGAVMLLEPDWGVLPRSTPPLLRRVLRRCLEKDPARRARDIADVRLDLEEVLEEPGESEAGVVPPPATSAQPPRSGARAALFAVGAFALGAGFVGVAGWLSEPELEPASSIVHAVLNGAGNPPVMVQTFLTDVAITPDGDTVVYAGAESLWVRPVGEIEGRPLAGSEGGIAPFVSSDGEWVGFFDLDRGELRKVSLAGGPPVTICQAGGFVAGASWGDDGSILYALGGGSTDLYRVSAAGGEPESLAVPELEGVTDVRWPELLEGSRTAIVSLISHNEGQSRIAVFDLDQGELRPLLVGGSHARYAASRDRAIGHLVYGIEGTLRVVGFDADRLETFGSPVPVLDAVVTKQGSFSADFALARDGSLVYVRDVQARDALETLVWIDREGGQEPILGGHSGWQVPAISPDGERVAIGSLDDEVDIWILDFARETLTRLTFGSAMETSPVWSPDGQFVYFASDRNGDADVFRRAADGAGAAELVWAAEGDQYPTSVSPDGRFLLYQDVLNDIGLLTLDEQPTGRPLLAGEYRESNGGLSPDGRWIVYQSNESGRTQIYVRPFPEVETGRWQVSSEGGTQPRWLPDGSGVAYRELPDLRRMLFVPIETQGGLRAGSPTLLFEVETRVGTGVSWDVHPDGRRFLMNSAQVVGAPGVEPVSTPEVVLIENWSRTLPGPASRR